jgi:hypothetical protein
LFPYKDGAGKYIGKCPTTGCDYENFVNNNDYLKSRRGKFTEEMETYPLECSG